MTATGADEDARLVQAWADGDRRAGDRFVQRHFDAVWRYFQTKLPDAADDAIQSVFATCTRYVERLRHARSARAYVLQIARHELYARIRSVHRDFEPALSSFADLGPSPSSLLARADDEQRVLAAMRTLPVQAQEMLELYYWEDLSTAELAEVFELEEATARSRLHRARAKLRDILDDPTPDAALRRLRP